ncbi:sodium:solute symporter [Kocuria coralli]|uniref:Sodium:solute symporter n=1 Tax=Kocuria coralli TaxID=1461025 RepID=A0A5J5KWB0_9MICC|nr:sodium:solute symporter [Kocuria coralli]KAA9393929.1 sodium:solute symporter [Kocuria coralli]
MNVAIIVLYLIAMVAVGLWAARRAASTEDFRVAGRRLGPFFYTGTMAAVVLGGASTVGGIGLGYTYGISGMWLVMAIASGLLVLSLVFAGRITRLKIYTVSQMLGLRYGEGIASRVSSVVMLAYTLMLAVTSTSAYASIFSVLLPIDRTGAILLGGAVVVAYSALGGMWSITLTDMMQFIFMTVGIFLILLPFSLYAAGGWAGMNERLDATFFSAGSMGFQSIITMFVVYGFGMLIGQDIWQRVFTARSPEVSRWGGTVSAVYVGLFGLAGAIIGTAAAAVLPVLENSDDAFALMAQDHVPAGLGGVVLAAGVAAMMSTASGALIASATVARVDVVPLFKSLVTKQDDSRPSLTGDRVYLLTFGVVVTIFSVLVPDVVTALTIAYDLLVGGLLVAILGGLIWRRGNSYGAAWSIVSGSVGVVTGMAVFGVMANAPIYIGLGVSAVVYVVVSLATRPTQGAVLHAWDTRLAGRGTAGAGAGEPDPAEREAAQNPTAGPTL